MIPMDIVDFIVIVFIMSIVVEAITEIITSSKLTEPIRRRIKEAAYSSDKPPADTVCQRIKIFIDDLISCGYCTSVWIAGFFAIWAPKIYTDEVLIDWAIITFALHRIATWIHVVYELIRKGRVKTYDVELKTTQINLEE